MTNAQISRRIAHLVKLQAFAKRKRRPARVRHYQRQLDALQAELQCAVLWQTNVQPLINAASERAKAAV